MHDYEANYGEAEPYMDEQSKYVQKPTTWGAQNHANEACAK